MYARVTTAAVLAVALAMSLYHLYIAFSGPPDAFTLRSTHIGFALVLAFLTLPWRAGDAGRGPRLHDWALVALSVAAAAYPVLNLDYILNRFIYIDDLRTGDVVFGVLMVGLIFEATRRAMGWVLPITVALFLGYALLLTGTAPLLLLEQLYLTTEGIFGIPAGVSATYVVLFILFGAFVERSGAGRLFMDFAISLTGHQAGGPAKVACITSGLFGSVSGSAVANVMTTGAFTIPLMKRLGYRPAFAGAVEAVASTGGQIMPPIMGAAAFVMAEFLGVSYLTVAAYAAIPALLYYLAVFAAVHFEAKRIGLVGLPRHELPHLGTVLRERGHLFLPLVVIVAVLLAGYSAPFSALCGIASVVPTALLRKSTRDAIDLRMIVEALRDGALGSVVVALACASAGIVIGVITLTGAGLSFSAFVIGAANETLLLALVLTMTAGIVLGMGMPTTPAYIIQVALLVPALVKLGVPVESAHMFVFYFAILSAITPPVAIAVYAANGLSGAALWESSVAAVKLGLTGYVIPYMFIFGPSLLMVGDWTTVLGSAVSATFGVVFLAAGLHGYLIVRATAWQRVLLVAAAFTLIKPGLLTDAAGLALAGTVVAAQLWAQRRPAAAPLGAGE
ncbi:TRAP transporter permease [Azospirillum sp. ST 5-10]|uniref:TRAP transporter permease n=1 Tax=unclassified Azospirillum TaxID=2630922 RepID=UPI003F49D390